VRVACIAAVAQVGDGEVGSALLKIVDNDHWPPLLRGAALAGLAAMEKLDDDVRGRVARRLHQRGSARGARPRSGRWESSPRRATPRPTLEGACLGDPSLAVGH
jgi:hypothetical protein